MAKIVVVGSSNTDMVIKTQCFPNPGETVLGDDFYMFPGGKGANQAVAASRAGGEVTFVCAVGDDVFGQNALKGYRREGIDLRHARRVPGTASGVALITVDASGENTIAVASGANAYLHPDHLEKALCDLGEVDIVLTQLETPIESIRYLADHCRKTGQRLIINPAPARELDESLLEGLFLLTPNETEIQMLTGVTPTDEIKLEEAGRKLLGKGVRHVIITRGSQGSFYIDSQESYAIPAHQVEAIDTTAAGDVFNGVLSVCLAKNKPWRESMTYAGRAAALSVTRMGAQASAPTGAEIDQFG